MCLNSCKEHTVINTNVTPGIDNIHTFALSVSGTDSIRTKQIFNDSVVTSGYTGNPVYQALGYVNADPYSGNTVASIYLQVSPPSTSYAFSTLTTAGLDSAFLILPYAGFTWGDTVHPSTIPIKVYQLADTLGLNATYYAFNKKATGMLVGTGSLSFGPASPGGHGNNIVDSPFVTGLYRAPVLRISLGKVTDPFLANLQTIISNVNNTLTYAAFDSVFNGLYIVPDTGGTGRALAYFRLDASTYDNYGQANVLIYGHTSSAVTDTVTYSFPYSTTNTAHFNRITRNYTNALVKGLFSQPAKSDPYVIVQNAPGGEMDIRLPYVKNLPQNVIINKAQLVFTEIGQPASDFPAYDTNFFKPNRIYPQGVDANGVRYNIADRYPLTTSDGLLFIDGTPQYRSVIVNSVPYTQYFVNVPRELQQAILQQRSELHLRIGGTANYPGAYRALFKGSGLPGDSLATHLNIVYSKQ